MSIDRRCDLYLQSLRVVGGSSVLSVTRLEVERKVRGSVRARIANWPYEPDVAQIVLLDHHMLPTTTAVAEWVARALAERPSTHTIRTGAMFPEAAHSFRAAGFRTIDTLALLEARLGSNGRRASTARRLQRPVTQRLRAHHLPDAAALDRSAFGDPWGNDVASLTSITDATPRHRARIVNAVHSSSERSEHRDHGADPTGGRPHVSGFAITGQSGAFGYLQRLAVHPNARRQGIARSLVADSMQWMQRRGATTAMVNTALDNEAALALYARAGFRRRTDTLTILELSGLGPSGPGLSGSESP
jgi:ribosomal protein S18 acetylase RimI-like enzyme